MNSVSIIGTLGQDPELRYTQSGKAKCSFSIAVRSGKDKTDWFNVEAWENTAEVIGEYFKKGSRIGLEGSLATDSWESEGQKKTKVFIRANKAHFIDKKEN